MRIYRNETPENVEIEQAAINREIFNYTEWQRDFFDNMSAKEFNAAAVNYELKNPFILP